VVNEFLEVLDYPGVWAVGDCAWIVDDKTDSHVRRRAQHAIREGACLARNLVATLRGEPKRAFAIPGRAKTCRARTSVRRRRHPRIQTLRLCRLVLWRVIYLMKLPGSIASSGSPPTGSSIWCCHRTSSSSRPKRRRASAASISSPCEVIFRQGDRGDRLYIVVDGEVEMVKEEPGKSGQVLARLEAESASEKWRW